MNLYDAPLSPGHRIARSAQDLQTMVNALRTARVRAFDTETDGLRWWKGDKPIGYSLGFIDESNRIQAWYVPVGHHSPEPQVAEIAAKAAFRDALDGSHELVGQNLKFDLNMCRAHGYEVPLWAPLHDTLIQAYLINENRQFSLESLVNDLGASPYGSAFELKDAVTTFLKRRAKEHKLPLKKSALGPDYTYLGRYGHAEVPIGLEGEYSCRDVGHALVLDRIQRSYARGQGTWYQDRREALYLNEMLLIRALADMEYVGQLLDCDYLGAFAAELDEYLDTQGRVLQGLFGATINWNNDASVRELLYDQLQLPVSSLTKEKKPSVDKAALLTLSERHPGIEVLAEWRQHYKVRSTYTTTLLEKVGPDGRIHCDFVQWGTATGRLSAKDPNLQNIPVRHKTLSKRLRRAWVIEPGMCRVHSDYSQIELRILGWATGCPNFIAPYRSAAYDAYCRGDLSYNEYLWARIHEPIVDVHGSTAKTVFHIDESHPEWEMKRNAAKTVNFGVPYGGGPGLLIGDPKLRMPPAEAQAFFEAYHRSSPEVTTSKARLFHSMRSNRDGGLGPSFVNWAGRMRHGPRLLWTRRQGPDCPVSEEERGMFASLIQGSAGELTRFSLVRLWLAQQRGDLPGRTTTTIHDDIGVDCAMSDRRFVAYEVRRIMEDFKGMFGPTPVVSDLQVTGTTWADKEEYEPMKETTA